MTGYRNHYKKPFKNNHVTDVTDVTAFFTELCIQLRSKVKPIIRKYNKYI